MNFRRIINRNKLIFSMFLSLTLILGYFPSSVQAQNKKDLSILENSNDYLNKIDSAVKEKLSEGKDEVEVLVYLKDRVDTASVARAQAVGKTKFQRELSSRKAVISALKEKAEVTQESLVNYLNKEKSQGKVKDLQSFYIANILYVKANEEVVNKIAARSDVEKIYLDKTIEIEKPNITSSVVKDMPEDEIEWNIKRVGAPNVWNRFNVDGSGVVVGIIDTGVQWDHPALKEKWRGYNPQTKTVVNPEDSWFDPIEKSSLPQDVAEIPHGSHVTGTVLGQEPDGKNTIGVAPGAKWIAAKAFTATGGKHFYILKAAEWMLSPNGKAELAPNIVNNSWGGSAGVDPWFKDVLNAWRAANILPVFAAGNQKPGEPIPGPGSIQNPSNLPGSFAVAATDINNIRGKFSKLGPSPWDPTLIKPDISAPGVNIRSSVIGGYESGWDGTSMASPHVAGVAALMKSANYSLTIDQIEAILRNTASKLTDSNYPESPNMGYGYGLLNSFDAVATVLGIGTGTIKGKVVVGGEDLIKPEIIHDKMEDVYPKEDVIVKATIKDNIAVTEAKLFVKNASNPEWQEIKMTLKSGNVRKGIFEATVPGSLVEKPGFDYKFEAKDYGDNVVQSDVFRANTLFGLVPDKYTNDLETKILGWSLTGEWEWGNPSYSLGPKAFNGAKVFGTKLSSYYSSNMTSILTTPALDLRDTKMKSASLRMEQWYDIDRSDSAQVLISTDEGVTWNTLTTLKGSQKEWKEISYDLTPYIGSEKPVKLSFKLETDKYGFGTGWYFDNVRLVGDDKEPPTVPKAVTATSTVNGISIQWDSSPEGDVSKYNIYRSETSGTGYALLGSSTTTQFIDETAEKGKTYYYVVSAKDFSENESAYSEEATCKLKELFMVYSSSFEEDNGGFTTGTIDAKGVNDWQWGVPTSGPMAAFKGKKVWATNLSGVYSNNQKSFIDSPEIKIPTNINPVLYFTHWLDTEKGYSSFYDWVNVQISEDNGATWKVIKDKFGGPVRSWETTEISLSAYVGKTVKVRFYLESDMVTGKDGWYIDSVSIAADSEGSNSVTGVRKEENKNLQMSKQANCQLEGKDDLSLESSEKVLPADAVVTILETGRSVRTDISNGSFKITHAATEEGKSWTLRAEAYGYYPKELKVNLKANETVDQVIKLDPIKQGSVKGKVYDKTNKKPVANATVRLLGDSNIDAVKTNAEGEFVINKVYAGNYTLKIISSEFRTENISITVLGEQDNVVSVPMKRFIGTTNEISYDDGTYELAKAFVNSGVGFGTRFTPNAYGRLKSAKIFFVKDHPNALGNKIGIGVVTVDEKGRIITLGDIKEVTITRGEWNEISLLDYDINTDKDFYIVTKQLYPLEQSPAIGIDANNTAKDRSYVYSGGLTPLADYKIDGGMMIRAEMEYETATPVTTPEITNLKEVNYTNKDSITLEGNMNVDGNVIVMVNGEEKATVETKDNLFTATLELEEGTNTITVKGKASGIETEPSKPITVIVDKTSPEITLETPKYGEMTNVEAIEVSGKVKDDNFQKLLINDKEVIVDEDGNFKVSIPAIEGENIIKVTAYDLAGNEATVTRKVNVTNAKITTPEIINLKEINYTNKDSITLEGRMNVDGKVIITLNDQEVTIVETKDKLFTATLQLKEGVNTITVKGEASGIETEPSKPITVIVDKALPEITLDTPKDGESTDKESTEISGKVKDNNFQKLLIDNKEVVVDKDGSFKVTLPLVKGENIIKVTAYDLAGNEATVTIKVVKTEKTVEIEDPKDNEDAKDPTENVITEKDKATTETAKVEEVNLPKTGAVMDNFLMMVMGLGSLALGYALIKKRS